MVDVVLVDGENREIGVMEKLEAHKSGKLHRAFSVLIRNTQGQWLIQRRALEKYHGGGLWSNAVCSHPLPGESYEDSIVRRMMDEIGIACEVKKGFEFIYRTTVGDLIEHEHDSVFFGVYDGEIVPNSEEVMEYRWVEVEALRLEISAFPDRFTPWFVLILEEIQVRNFKF